MTAAWVHLQCSACQHMVTLDAAGRLRLLQRHGHLRRVSDPHSDLVDPLFTSQRESFVCSECKSGPLVIATAEAARLGGQSSKVVMSSIATSQRRSSSEDDPEFWGETRRCETCGGKIASERLQVLPDTKLCMACAQTEQCATACSTLSDESCPRCGNWLHWITRRSSLQNHALSCRHCGYLR